MGPLKITFNKPAVRQFFEIEGARGVRLRVEGDDVLFQTVKDLRQKDALKLEERTRGGFEVTLAEGNAEAVLATLRAGKPRTPFYLFRRNDDGWYRLVPYVPNRKTNDMAPPKFDPHLRVWTKEPFVVPDIPEVVAPSAPTVAPVAPPPNPTLDEIREAFDLLHRSASGPSAVPSQDVMRAREMVAAFETTARDLLPSLVAKIPEGAAVTPALGANIDMRAVAHTMAFLGNMLTKHLDTGGGPTPTGPNHSGPQPSGNGSDASSFETRSPGATHMAPSTVMEAPGDARADLEPMAPEPMAPEPVPTREPLTDAEPASLDATQEPVPEQEPEQEPAQETTSAEPTLETTKPEPAAEPAAEPDVDDLDDAQVERAKAALGLTKPTRMQIERRGKQHVVYPNKGGSGGTGGSGRQKLTMGTFRK